MSSAKRASGAVVMAFLVLSMFSSQVSAQKTVTVNLGDLFKRKPPTSARQEGRETPFSIWQPRTPQPEIGSCGAGRCSSVRYVQVEPASGGDVDEAVLRTRFEVETAEDERPSSIEVVEEEVRCSLKRPAIDGNPVEIFADGQPTSAGSTAEKYLLLCHSFSGEPAEGARRFGYPLIASDWPD